MTCLCHCKNCRQTAGSMASTNTMVPESAVKITREPKIYQDGNTTSEATIQRAFCGNCDSPIYTATPNISDMQIVKLGLFDEMPKPTMELYCKARVPWSKPVDDAKQFDTMPTQ